MKYKTQSGMFKRLYYHEYLDSTAQREVCVYLWVYDMHASEPYTH